MIFSSAEDMANYLSRFGESNQIFKGEHLMQYRFEGGTMQKRAAPYKAAPTSYKYSISKIDGVFYFKTERHALSADEEYIIKLYKNKGDLAGALEVGWTTPARSMVWLALFPKSNPDSKALVLCV